MADGIGRPSVFSEELAASICARIADGESLREICRDDAMPARSTVHLWLATNGAFSDHYARACDLRAESMFEEMLEIADDGSNDWTERNGSDDAKGSLALNGEHVQRSRLRIDARKWALSRMNPRKYGDRQAVEHTGKDGGPIETQDVTPIEKARRIAFVLASGAQEVDNG